jgi:hypothetical protein
VNTISPERIRRADPLAEREPAVEPDELRSRIDEIVAHDRPVPRAKPRRRRMRVAVALGAATAVVVAALASLPGGSSRETPATAASILNAAAAVAAEQPEPLPFTGYRYTEWLERDRGVIEQRVETWVDSEWHGRRIAHQGRILHGSGDPSWKTRIEPRDEEFRYDRYILIPPPRVADLPTEPKALREALIAHERSHWEGRFGPATPERLNDTVTHRVVLLLGQPDTGPELRAALFGALALMPGVRPAPDARDALGRTGQAVAIPQRYSEMTVIFDRDTSQMLFWSEGSIARTVVRTARVANIGDRP